MDFPEQASNEDISTVPEGSPMGETVLLSQPGPYDVLMGRGAPLSDHSGNVRLREIVVVRQVEYTKTTKRSDKNRITREIIASVSTNGGRFLRRVDATTASTEAVHQDPKGTVYWEEVEEGDEIIQKVKQLLRDMQPRARARREQRRLTRKRPWVSPTIAASSSTTEAGDTEDTTSSTKTIGLETQPSPVASSSPGRSLRESLYGPVISQSRAMGLRGGPGLGQVAAAALAGSSSPPFFNSLGASWPVADSRQLLLQAAALESQSRLDSLRLLLPPVSAQRQQLAGLEGFDPTIDQLLMRFAGQGQLANSLPSTTAGSQAAALPFLLGRRNTDALLPRTLLSSQELPMNLTTDRVMRLLAGLPNVALPPSLPSPVASQRPSVLDGRRADALSNNTNALDLSRLSPVERMLLLQHLRQQQQQQQPPRLPHR